MAGSLVRKVDHVFVPLGAAERGFRFLTETIALPTAWPYDGYGAFASGGVGLGNANLEVLQSSPAFPFSTARTPARVQGIAFEPRPIDSTFLDDIDTRGIAHSPAMPFHGTRFGTTGLLWTNVFFAGLTDERSVVFACEYAPGFSADSATRRATLRAVNGGRLGVEMVEEIVIGSRDPARAMAPWRRLLAPLEPVESGLWAIGDGPALRFVEAPADEVLSLVLRVHSLAAVSSAIRALGLNADTTERGLRIAPTSLEGLVLDLVPS